MPAASAVVDDHIRSYCGTNPYLFYEDEVRRAPMAGFYPAQYFRSDVPTATGHLYVSATRDASRRGIKIKAGTKLYICSWELQNELLCVRLENDALNPPMYVPPKHLLIWSRDEHWRYVIETDETWYSRPLLVRINDMHVRVSHGNRESMVKRDEDVFNLIIPHKKQVTTTFTRTYR